MLRRILAVFALGALFWACTPLEDPGPDKPGGRDSLDSASIQVFNYIGKDPGEISLLLFGPNTTDDQGPFLHRFTPAIPEKESRTFRVPAGVWKLGIEDAVKLQQPLKEDSGSIIWPSVQVVKDGNYFINISTDAENHNIWRTDLTLIR